MSTHLHDLPSAAVVAAGFAPAVIADAAAGPAVDLAAGDGPCFAVQLVGAAAADCTLSGALEQSANGTAWAAVAGGEFATVAAAGNTQVLRFARTARYVRWVGTPDGGSPSFAVAVVFIQEKKLF